MNPSLLRIMLVEDDENDVFIMKRAMSKANLGSPMHVAINGREAIEYLSGAGKYADRVAYPLPEFVFLDLKLPFVNGFEVLEWIQAQPSLRDIKVLILTSSPEDRDRLRSQQLGAKSYHVKPPNPEMLLKIMKSAAEQGNQIECGRNSCPAPVK